MQKKRKRDKQKEMDREVFRAEMVATVFTLYCAGVCDVKKFSPLVLVIFMLIWLFMACFWILFEEDTKGIMRLFKRKRKHYTTIPPRE